MPGRPDPASARQIQLRAKDLKDPASGWTQQVLENLAAGIIQATAWLHWEETGGTPGPDDIPGSWPRLPDEPGGEVRLGVQEALADAEAWKGSFSPELVREVAATLAETLRHTPLLGPAFYQQAAVEVGRLLTADPAPEVTVSAGRQSLWRKPEHPHGLPPKGHPLTAGVDREQLARHQVTWAAARKLYRSLGSRSADEEGRQGLERPGVLRQWAERLQLMDPDSGLMVAPLGGQPSLRAATGLPWSRAQSTLLSPRLEEQGNGRPPGQLHRPRRGDGYEALVSLSEHGSAISEHPMAWAHLERAQALLEQNGPEMARLSLYLSMLVCRLDDPTAPFLVTGDALLEDFGLERSSGGGGRSAVLERSRKLKQQAEMARLLERVTVTCTDRTGKPDKQGNRPFRRFSGRVWQIDSLELGTETQLSLDGRVDVQAEEVVRDLRLLIRAGSWVKLYLATGEKGGLWYGHVATQVLRLSHHRNKLAAVLGLHLSTALYERKGARAGEVEFQVAGLLEKVLPPKTLQRALEDRRYSETLRNQWVAALEVLHHAVGFRFRFCPTTYPDWAIPEVLQETSEDIQGRAPHGALEQLLQGRITVLWPEPVLEANGSSKAEAQTQALAQVVTMPALTASKPAKLPRGRTNGRTLKDARTAAGLSQRAAAALFEISPGQVSKLEGDQKTLSRNDLDRYLQQLGEVSRQQRFRRLKSRP